MRRARSSPIPTSERHSAGQDAGPLLTGAFALDRARALTCLFAPAEGRGGLAALVWFHAELARIPLLVNETMAALVRFQWWRDALAAPSGRSGQPSVDALHAAAATGQIRTGELVAIVDAWAELVEGGGPTNGDAVFRFAGRTSGALHGAMARLLAAGDEWTERAREAGRALGVTQLLRNLPALAQREIVPRLDGLDQAVLSRSLRDRAAEPALRTWVRGIAGRTAAEIASVRAVRPPRRLLAPLLAATLARRDLRRLRAAGYDPFALERRLPGSPLPALLLAAARRRP